MYVYKSTNKTGALSRWVECLLMARDRGVPTQVESHQIQKMVLDDSLINT